MSKLPNTKLKSDTLAAKVEAVERGNKMTRIDNNLCRQKYCINGFKQGTITLYWSVQIGTRVILSNFLLLSYERPSLHLLGIRKKQCCTFRGLFKKPGNEDISVASLQSMLIYSDLARMQKI